MSRSNDRPALSWFGLPLLEKELTERAARKRTYVLRVGFALVLYALIGGELLAIAGATTRSAVMLGEGREVFWSIVQVQWWALAVVLPISAGSVIASEKERQTLGLLLLTPIRHGELILQKYVGCVVPMLTFLLVGLPPLALAYTIGGVARGVLPWVVVILGLASLQIAACSLLCSAYFRTSAQAILAAYLATGLLGLVPYGLLESLCHLNTATVRPQLASAILDVACVGVLTVIICLWSAKRWLLRRADIQPRYRVRAWLRQVDTFWGRWDGTIWGWRVSSEASELPVDEPLAWRELNRKAFVKTAHVVRLLLVAEAVAVLASIGWLSTVGFEADGGRLSRVSQPAWSVAGALQPTQLGATVSYLLWVAAVTSLVVVGVNAFALERSSQTLDVMLTTPLASSEIVEQKYHALQRLAVIWAVPLWTLYGTRAWATALRSPVTGLVVFGLMVYAVILYLNLANWLGLWAGLALRGRRRALGLGVGLLGAICVLPGPLSPFRTFAHLGQSDGGWWLLFNGVLWLPVLFWLRHHCLLHADWCLRREGHARAAELFAAPRLK